MKENKNLHNAKVAKDDEFYTLIEDIENECEKYKAQFEDKIIYCNCDDPIQSNFFKYFANSFKRLKLKKLICTCYDKGMFQKQDLWWDTYENDLGITVSPKRAYKIVIDEAIDYNNDGAFNWDDVASLIKNDIETNSFKYVSYLNEDGDFRSAECVELLKEADIVVTNPPFSLFREFIALLEKYNKKYLIIGNKNAITYKDTFALIKANKLWLGYTNVSTFIKPDGTEKKFGNIGWFTNLDTYIRHTELDLYKKYNETDYPKYDNYDAINVDKVTDIPCDYFGVMGVPITFLDKYNPDQFEIVGSSSFDETPCRIDKNYTDLGYQFLGADGKSISTSGALRDKTSPKIPGNTNSKGDIVDYSVSPEGTYLHSLYGRIFIKRKGEIKNE